LAAAQIDFALAVKWSGETMEGLGEAEDVPSSPPPHPQKQIVFANAISASMWRSLVVLALIIGRN
jgi:hypothetical protein